MYLLFALLSASLGASSSEPTPDEATVQRAVTAARAGDRDAARKLYTWHVARVFRVVRPLGRSDADAEDVTQETFVRALGALARYEPKPGARFVSWLLTIAENTARKRGAKLGRGALHAPETLTPLLDAQDAADDASAEVELARLRAALLTSLGELDARERWVMCLRYGGELEVGEVAELTGLSAANVRKICERQRRRLLARLAERGFAAEGAEA